MTIQITPEKFNAALAQLKAKPGVQVNFDPNDNTGEAVGHGVSASFHYDGAAELYIEIEGEPWYMPESAVESHIAAFFQ